MREGWHNGDYLVLFDDVAQANARYEAQSFLPGFDLVGLHNWEEFIVRGPSGSVHLVPTVPLAAEHLHRYVLRVTDAALVCDPTLSGRYRWRLKPVAFGGDPSAPDNVALVTPEQHGELVRWWNAQFCALQSRTGA
jgi:hypothetical protein